MSLSMEPIESFRHMVDNIAQWLTKLDDLNARCDEQYERFYKLTKDGEVKLTREKRSASTKSIRARDTKTVPFLQIDDAKEHAAAPAKKSAARAITSEAEPVSPRAEPLPSALRPLKRKPESALSAASGNDGHPTKSMTVVYYDSIVQEGFEAIVKNLSTARGVLRKGRTTATFKTRMASIGLPLFDSDTSSSAKLMVPTIDGTRHGVAEKRKFKVYDETDRHLEEAQNLSEKAAHQVLRGGDCNIEIQAIRKRLRAIQKLSTDELERLKGEEHGSLEQSDPFPLDSGKGMEKILDRDYPRYSPPRSCSEIIEVDPPKQTHFVATGDIEVDDASSESSSINIDMNAIRRVSRRAA